MAPLPEVFNQWQNRLLSATQRYAKDPPYCLRWSKVHYLNVLPQDTLYLSAAHGEEDGLPLPPQNQDWSCTGNIFMAFHIWRPPPPLPVTVIHPSIVHPWWQFQSLQLSAACGMRANEPNSSAYHHLLTGVQEDCVTGTHKWRMWLSLGFQFPITFKWRGRGISLISICLRFEHSFWMSNVIKTKCRWKC